MQANSSDVNHRREREDRRKQALGLVEYLHVAAKAAGDKKLQEAYLAAFRALDSVRERTFEDLGHGQ
jgi:hypothetical protein